MAKMVTNTNGRSITKRVISESSSEEDTPIAKRTKSDTKLQAGQKRKPSSTTQPEQDAPTSSALSSEDQGDVLGEARRRLKQTGEDQGMVDSSDMDDDDNQPIANSNYKPTIAPKRSIDESSASTTRTTNTEVPSIKTTTKLPKIKKHSQVAAQPTVKPEPLSSSDDDQPLVSRQPVDIKPSISTTKRRANNSKKEVEDSESEDSEPLCQTSVSKAKTKPKPSTKPSRVTKKSPASKVTVKKELTPSSTKPKRGKAVKKEEDQVKEEEGDEEDEQAMYTWWEEHKDDHGDTPKWKTLEHNGVLFPPDYEPLPSHVKMKYDGKPLDLPPESEEVAFFFGSMLNSDHVQKPTFCENFFMDWLQVLETYPPRDGTEVTEFSKCDFEPMFEYACSERDRKKAMTKEEKTKMKAEKEEQEKKFKTCILDGRVEKVGNFRVEPPSLFRGRGDHPKTGRLKKRVMAEEIHINCGADSKFPEPPPGHKWAEIVHNEKASWLAWWKENINGNTKYVFLAAGSSLASQSDLRKFEKARKLKFHIDDIRATYTREMKDRLMATRQRATAMYLIDKFAFRAGNEKDKDNEADTVGCCSLRCEHVTLEPPRTVTFDFLGKDSIRFFNKFEVDEAVFKNLMIFKRAKEPIDDIFDRLNTGLLNKYLVSLMPGLTAKVFRTYNASTTFEQELDRNMKQLPTNATEAEKLVAFNKANRQVAVLCNHQKAVSKNHGASMEKASDKIRIIKYRRKKVRLDLLAHQSQLDAQSRAFCQIDESDIDDEWMENYEESTEQKKRDNIQKKHTKLEEEAEKLKRSGGPVPETKTSSEGEEDELGDKKKKKKKTATQIATEKFYALTPEERENKLSDELASCEGHALKLRREREELTLLASSSTGKKTKNNKEVNQISQEAVDELFKKLKNIDKEIFVAKALLKDRDDGKETSLGTSKTNYIDPRLSFAWARKFDVKVNKIFAKTLQEKFTWAASTPADWQF
ncbi:hypothetical protein Pst134EA_022910 [Puccinia striiformis f. sp. tritici]|uniref:hypothetical protein n=1 Tax=Puccinia striiformis f. sp. tritici TaxID=168172 RepID=UPI00200782EB|nr:hypothetical protein Pst134EA_022910 [Puccinia striiformis f. sp. tritici]KAH9455446.1 hypothetical protein Pst134EA_022910 [Puccinia striiformis f. sp. tritici]